MNLTKKPLCSICCLSYNHSRFIEKHIRCIWEQTYPNIEIIVLDDGSSDKSLEILNRMKDNSPIDMKVLHQNNSGNIAKNLNKLLSLASGEYIVFISCDDLITSDTILSKITILEENENIAFVASKQYYEIDDDDNILKKSRLEHIDDSVTTTDSLLELEYSNFGTFYIQSAVFRKKLIDKVNGYDEDLLGDDIVIRIKLFLYMKEHTLLSFRFIDDFGFYYRIHDNNLHKDTVRQIKLILEVIERYFPNRDIPPLLKKWICHGINTLSMDKVIEIFSISSLTFNLLSDNEIQQSFKWKFSHLKFLIDSGNGFINDSSIKSFPISRTAEMQEFIFDFSNYDKIKNLRLVPLNDYCIIKICRVVLYTNNEELDLSNKFSSNSVISEHPYYFFSTNNPYIDFELSGFLDLKKIIVNFQLVNTGSIEVLESIIDKQNLELKKTKNSKLWKLITFYWKIKNFLIRIKSIPNYLKFYCFKLYKEIILYFDKGNNYQDKILLNNINSEMTKKALIIFSHYDKDNIIDDYVVNYLTELKKLGSDILFVSTSENMLESEANKISSLCCQVIIKQNIGYDFGAWRTGIEIMSDKLRQYEQLILCNDSVYAPLFDLNEMFKQMDRKFDFWGITDNYQHKHHIQSYFMVFSRKVFLEKYFLDFWKNIKVFKHKESIVRNYEIGLTKLIRNKKHIYGAYCPSSFGDKKNSTHYYWKKLILEQKAPIIKIELLRDNPTKTDISDWENILLNNKFDINMIKNHLKRIKKSK